MERHVWVFVVETKEGRLRITNVCYNLEDAQYYCMETGETYFEFELE